MYRKTYMEIDTERLKKNIKKIKTVYKDYKYYFGVVKNNAYGHGIECIKYMKEAGINYFAVSSLEEALEIRKIDSKTPVLVLEPITIEAAIEASKHNITITIDDKKYYDELKTKKIKLKYHIKIDTGMNRFGTKCKEDITDMYNDANKYLYLEGIYTHLTTGNINSDYYYKHINEFMKLTEDINLNKIDIVHLDRSLTMEQHDKLPFANGVRLGIIMYGFANRGFIPSKINKLLAKFRGKTLKNIKPKLQLEQVASFKSTVIEIKNVKKGEVVGYAGMHIASEDEKIAIVPYGFADYLYNNLTYVSIKNCKYKTIAINMDVTIILVDEKVKVGDTVEIFGDNINLRTKALDTNQNVYKVLASVSNRVPRIYKEKDKSVEIKY